MAAAHRAQHLDRPQDAQRRGKLPLDGGREPAGRRVRSRAKRTRPATGARPGRGGAGGAAGRWRARSWCCARSRIFVQADCDGARSADRHRHVAHGAGAGEVGGRTCAAAWEGGSMDCPTCEAMVDAYVDGELTASESAAFERALEALPRTAGGGCEAARTMSGAAARRCRPSRRPTSCGRAIERELRAIAGPRVQPSSARLRWARDGGQPDRGARHRLAGRQPRSARAAARPMSWSRATSASP